MSDREYYDNTVAQDAGYAAGAVEGEYDQFGNVIRRDENYVESIPSNVANATEQGFENAVQDVENVPSDVGGMVRGAANKIGEFFGGAQEEGREAAQDVNRWEQGAENGMRNEYRDAENDVNRWEQGAENGVRNEYRDAENDAEGFGQGVRNEYDQAEGRVDRFGEGVENSYQQGENEGKRDGW